MIKNYILPTFRSISCRKGFSALNVIGSSTGVAAGLLILQDVKGALCFVYHHHCTGDGKLSIP